MPFISFDVWFSVLTLGFGVELTVGRFAPGWVSFLEWVHLYPDYTAVAIPRFPELGYPQ